MAGVIDPTVTANYPVILGDGLIGKNSNEIFTGIHYNHRPTSATPENARLKPALPGSTTSFDLSYSHDNKKYAFAGTRNTNSNQYVLYFDPAREAFILDRIDSTFDMNLTRLPDNSDPDSLRRKYPHIGSGPRSKELASTSISTSTTNGSKKATPRPQKGSPLMQSKKSQEKKEPKADRLALPKPSAPKPMKTKARPSKPKPKFDEEDEDEEDDDALLIEYPDGDPKKKKTTDFSPAFPSVRRFDDFMDARESEGDDADGESDDEPEDLRLPSPLNHQNNNEHDREEEEEEEEEPNGLDAMDVDEPEHDGGAGDDFADLEKDMENAFEDLEEEEFEDVRHSPGPAVVEDHDESEISEED